MLSLHAIDPHYECLNILLILWCAFLCVVCCWWWLKFDMYNKVDVTPHRVASHRFVHLYSEKSRHRLTGVSVFIMYKCVRFRVLCVCVRVCAMQ